MSIKLKFIDNKIRAIIPAGRQKPDYETIFPDMQMPEELLDKYGNGQYEISVTVKEVTDDMGTHTVTECKPILKPMKPTAEQVERYKKKRYVEEIEKVYSKDDEIALAFRGTEEEKKEHEDFVAKVKKKVNREIDNEVMRIKNG